MSLNAEMIEEVVERATEELIAMNLEIIEATLGIGDEPLDRADRIARFLDDSASGALDAMKVIRPDLYDAAIAEFRRDVNASPLMQGEDD